MNDSKSIDEYSSVLTLTLHPDNPANTTILDESGDTVYNISTTFDAKSIPTTSVLNEQGKLVADWRWKESRLDSQMLRFEGAGVGTVDNGPVEVEEGGTWRGHGKERSTASGWLRKTLIPYKQTVAFRDLKGREFQWQNNAPGLHLQVYFLSPSSSSANIITLLPIQLASATNTAVPMARYISPIIDPKLPKGSTPIVPAKLLLDEQAEEIMDLVIVSWALLEKGKRESEISGGAFMKGHTITSSGAS
ncbi:uncharacterized protein STEHIDRAFT_163285 [Stereum hirsutum FP-91666 SS1]|uniref:DUF6593 domain-containing protein n=1 Tax=Stereum hirsutum (strain FP-91666) TaxID=721885 RepID=R7RXD3_STEHR|nr:uncharacterized protein STEHIDRAFT_163285 [Stereum hirsutum FP-91666 SS1]EIM80036.1 hypothetical protein STEHIDRAFT_163285 [Stereum hirsutum FP-91666 SS1]